MGVLDLLRAVVEGAPPEEQDSNATAVIVRTFNETALLLQEENTSLTVKDKREVKNTSCGLLYSMCIEYS